MSNKTLEIKGNYEVKVTFHTEEGSNQVIVGVCDELPTIGKEFAIKRCSVKNDAVLSVIYEFGLILELKKTLTVIKARSEDASLEVELVSQIPDATSRVNNLINISEFKEARRLKQLTSSIIPYKPKTTCDSEVLKRVDNLKNRIENINKIVSSIKKTPNLRLVSFQEEII
jgi:hypothetical protein